uniref:Nucleosome assembly protein n=1 Tax=Kalanchoe fedtschenkoi TaxID=63787 RepID=A0A7N0V8G1_KALFE
MSSQGSNAQAAAGEAPNNQNVAAGTNGLMLILNQRKQIVNGEPVVLDRFRYAETRHEYGRGLRGFWAIAMKENELLQDFITDRDAEVLEFLKDVKCVRTEYPGGFRLDFIFRENPHFRNEVLCKNFFMADENETVLEAGGGSTIDWYEGRALGMHPTRFASFFNFFEQPAAPGRNRDQAREKASKDLQIGIAVKNEIIPHAVSWLTGEAVPPVEDEDEEMDGSGEDSGPGEIDDDLSDGASQMEMEDGSDEEADDEENP